MSVMLYKSGRGTKVWGKELQSKVVVDDDVEELLAEGWYEHPGDVPEASGVGTDEMGLGSDGGLPSDTNTLQDMGEVSDGYHTFNELYAHRVRLFSTLMNAFPKQAWWSFQHHDGEQWEGWVLAGIDTPEGPVTYHLPESEIENLPQGTEIEFGKEWDGHTADDVLSRLLTIRPEAKKKGGRKPNPEPEAEPHAEVNDEPDNEG